MRTIATVRPAEPKDAEGMRDLLNEIIAIGGTTAFEDPLDRDSVTAEFITADALVCSHVVEDSAGDVAAFQYLVAGPPHGDGIGSIASFARQTDPVKGAGRALFPRTRDAAKAAGLTEIEAKIRADNVPGLAYYSKMGFVDHHVVTGVPLKDGTPVDRTVNRLPPG